MSEKANEQFEFIAEELETLLKSKVKINGRSVKLNVNSLNGEKIKAIVSLLDEYELKILIKRSGTGLSIIIAD